MFILNFTRNLLRRDLRSLPPVRHDSCQYSPFLCVTEFNTSSLQDAVNQPQDMVLLVYAGWCGFCTSLSHVFLHLAHYFRTSANITFARINGETNDLPWEFTMESYPSIIFFPAYGEADSIAFPDNVTPSLPNLIRFVLQHTTFTTRLHLAADVCTATCIQENLDLSKHTLHALRTKLHHLKARWSMVQLSQHNKGRASQYHSEMGKLLKKRIGELKEEIAEVKILTEFLEHSKGKPLDQIGMQSLLQDKMQRKDLFVGR